MKKMIIGLMAAAFMVLLPLATNTRAERVLTEGQIATITSTCVSTQIELGRLHNLDAVMRLNVGQQYENIFTRLMSPLNGRLAINQISSAPLVTVADQYKDALDAFRDSYNQYERSMTAAIEMKCEEKPIEFYAAIEVARQHRTDLRKKTVELNKLLGNYRNEFRTIQKTWRGQS